MALETKTCHFQLKTTFPVTCFRCFWKLIAVVFNSLNTLGPRLMYASNFSLWQTLFSGYTSVELDIELGKMGEKFLNKNCLLESKIA